MAMTIADLSRERIRQLFGDNFVLDQAGVDGPMADQDMYDQFPMWGNENERRFDKYPAPMTPQAELPPPVRQGGGQPTAAQAPMPSAAPAAPEMQNWFQRTTPGNVGPKVSMDFAAVPQQGGGQALDYSSPIDIAGFGKGYRMKGDPTRIVLADGRIVRTNVDSAAEAKARQQREEMDLKRMVAEAQVRRLDRMGGVGGAGALPPGLKLKPGERYNPETQSVEIVPGSDLERKVVGDIAEEKKGLRALDQQYGTVGQAIAELERAPGLNAAVGWMDSLLPKGVSLTPQDKANAVTMIENLKEKLETKGLQDLRASGVAPGAITEKEWRKFSAAIGNLDPSQSEDAFKAQLANIKTILESYRADLAKYEQDTASQYGERWGGERIVGRQSGAADQAQLIQEAMDAIKRGANREAVIQRLQSKGVPTGGL